MNLNWKTDRHEYPVFGFSMSLILHAVIITAAALILNSVLDESVVMSSYVQLRTIESQAEQQSQKSVDEITDKTNKVDEKSVPSEEIKTLPEESSQNAGETIFYDLSNSKADTSDLVQVYRENTLDVTVKYPAGWTYIDQNVKNKLDGVTFWTTSTNYNPPPYVHIEVKDKDLFNPKRFNHSYKTRNYTAYYNEPVELEGQITQIIYIRTDTEKDFSLKLIMKGKEAFKSFQPVFFGMVKSFKYGNQFF